MRNSWCIAQILDCYEKWKKKIKMRKNNEETVVIEKVFI